MTTQAKKERMAQEREAEKCRVHDVCEAHKVEFELITDYQIRIAGKLDVYPTAKKYCWLFAPGGARWGMYHSIEHLLREYDIIS